MFNCRPPTGANGFLFEVVGSPANKKKSISAFKPDRVLYNLPPFQFLFFHF